MRGRGPALSEWELDELLMHARAGWTARELAHYYGVSERTVVRYLRQARNGDISPAGRRVE